MNIGFPKWLCCKIGNFSEYLLHIGFIFDIDVGLGGDILFDGPRFYPKPYSSITITVWIKLTTNLGRQSVFDTIGGNASTHTKGQYHLEIVGGRVRWFHRNEREKDIFSVETNPLIEIGNWMHLAVTYDGVFGMARVGRKDSCLFHYYCI